MAKQKIRIRLKGYDHRLVDQSAEKLLKLQNVLEQKFLGQSHYQQKKQYTQFYVQFTFTKIAVNNSNNVHTNA